MVGSGLHCSAVLVLISRAHGYKQFYLFSFLKCFELGQQ